MGLPALVKSDLLDTLHCRCSHRSGQLDGQHHKVGVLIQQGPLEGVLPPTGGGPRQQGAGSHQEARCQGGLQIWCGPCPLPKACYALLWAMSLSFARYSLKQHVGCLPGTALGPCLLLISSGQYNTAICCRHRGRGSATVCGRLVDQGALRLRDSAPGPGCALHSCREAGPARGE